MTVTLKPMVSNSGVQTRQNAISNVGQVAQKGGGMGFGNAFSMGYTVGYSGVTMMFNPWLAYKKAKYEKKKMRMQADLYRMQAPAYHTAADDVWRAGQKQAASISYQLGQQKSSARNTMAAAGIQVGAAGSSAETLAAFDIVRDIQINDTMAAACANAWGYRRAAVDETNQAMAYEATAKSISPWAAAISTMASDAISLMDMNGGGQKTNGGASWKDFASFGQMFSSSGSSAGSSAGGGIFSGGKGASMAFSLGGK